MSITLCEPFRAAFYTPFYLPFALGYYEAEGVDVSLLASPEYGRVAEQLREGFADVYWGGPMRIMRMHDRGEGPAVRAFCEMVTRDPFFIIGAQPNPEFEPAQLAGTTLHSVSEVPTPWLCLQDDLRRAGIDPDTVTRIADRSMVDNAQALRDGAAQVVQLFQPFAEALLTEGAGHLWYAQAHRGPCSYTTLYATCETLENRADDLHRMTRAALRAQRWLEAAAAEDVAAAVSGYFPEIGTDLLAAIVTRYRSLGVWGRDPRLPETGFERLRDALHSGGFIASRPPFDACVDNRLAETVIAEQA